jgi:hypothetical protein
VKRMTAGELRAAATAALPVNPVSVELATDAGPVALTLTGWRVIYADNPDRTDTGEPHIGRERIPVGIVFEAAHARPCGCCETPEAVPTPERLGEPLPVPVKVARVSEGSEGRG